MERVVERYAHLAEQLVIQQPPGIPVVQDVAWPQVAVLQPARHAPNPRERATERREAVRPYSRGRQVRERSLASGREVDSGDSGPQTGQIPRGAAGDVLGREQHLLCGASPRGDATRSEVGLVQAAGDVRAHLHLDHRTAGRSRPGHVSGQVRVRAQRLADTRGPLEGFIVRRPAAAEVPRMPPGFHDERVKPAVPRVVAGRPSRRGHRRLVSVDDDPRPVEGGGGGFAERCQHEALQFAGHAAARWRTLPYRTRCSPSAARGRRIGLRCSSRNSARSNASVACRVRGIT